MLECCDPGPRVYKTLSPAAGIVNTVNSIYAGHTLPSGLVLGETVARPALVSHVDCEL